VKQGSLVRPSQGKREKGRREREEGVELSLVEFLGT